MIHPKEQSGIRRDRILVSRVVVGFIGLGLLGGGVFAQEGLDGYGRPILTRNGQGHFATIKDLVFTPDGRELLSAGLDKVIHVWDLAAAENRPVRTLRPPIFRGEAGQITSIALSPDEVEPGQRLIAIGGRSPGFVAGTIVLMRYPGRPAGGDRGDLLGYLQTPSGAISNRISRLSFDPQGRLVSTDLAGRLALWDIRGVGRGELSSPESIAAIQPLEIVGPADRHLFDGGMVLAQGPDAAWAVTGEGPKVTRWDLRTRQAINLLDLSQSPNEANDFIRCLAGGARLGWVVAGTDRGRIWQVSVTNAFPPILLRSGGGAVLGVDVSSNGRQFAASVGALYPADRAARPPIDRGEVILLEAQAGVLATRSVRTARLAIDAVRFSPNSPPRGPTLLASGGGVDQAVLVHDTSQPAGAAPVFEASGPGSTVWDLGFVAGPGPGPVLAYSRDPDDYGARRASPAFHFFQLGTHATDPELAGPVSAIAPGSERYPVQPVDAFTLRVSGNGGPRQVVLDRGIDGRWLCWAVIPPGPGGDPMIAVGTAKGGVAVFRVGPGAVVQTRLLYGHEAAVTALAVSADRKWLASGSADQSVRLWAIDGFERVPSFGAEGEFREGKLRVKSVASNGFADQRGLRKDDIIESAKLEERTDAGRRRIDVPLTECFAKANALEADRQIQLKGQRAATGEAFDLIALKRTSPLLSFFIEKTGRDWIVWSPKGPYATSVQADDLFLGWHQNVVRPVAGRQVLFPDTLSTVFSRASTHQKEFQDSKLIRALVTGNPPAVPVPADPQLIPRPVVQVAAERVAVAPVVEPGKAPPLIKIVLGTHELVPGEFERLADGTYQVGRQVLEKFGRDAIVTASATDTRGNRSDPTIVPLPNAARPLRGRLVVLACGVGRPDDSTEDRGVLLAEPDVKALASALRAGRLRSPVGGEVLANLERDVTVLDDPFEFAKRLKALTALGGGEALGPGDVLIVVIEARSLFSSGGGAGWLQPRRPDPDRPGAPMPDLRADLGRLADQGARVVVLLDDVHDPVGPEADESRREWLSSLLDSRVAYFRASDRVPSLPATPTWNLPHRLFAQGLLGALNQRGTEMTLETFAKRVRDDARSRGDNARRAAERMDLKLPDQFKRNTPFLVR
jgi:WD40 repeat protein